MTTGKEVVNRETGELAVRSVSDVLREHDILPEMVEIDTILGQQIEVLSIKPADGDYGPFLIITIKDPDSGKTMKTTCGGEILCDKLQTVGKLYGFPVLATFTKPGRYYDVE